MAYSEFLADRVRQSFDEQNTYYRELKMLGGLCFMVDEKMCMGVLKDQIMARVDPERYEELLTKEGCMEMDFTGKVMKGFVFVTGDGIDTDEDLDFWVAEAIAFNPRAKASKKKR